MQLGNNNLPKYCGFADFTVWLIVRSWTKFSWNHSLISLLFFNLRKKHFNTHKKPIYRQRYFLISLVIISLVIIWRRIFVLFFFLRWGLLRWVFEPRSWMAFEKSTRKSGTLLAYRQRRSTHWGTVVKFDLALNVCRILRLVLFSLSYSAEEVTVILANVSRHLTFLRSSVSFVQKHLNTVREPLDFVQVTLFFK